MMSEQNERSSLVALVRETFGEFQRHKTQWLAAAIAYFSLFAIGPLIIIVVEAAALFLGRHQTALSEIYSYVSAAAGRPAADSIKIIVTATLARPRTGIVTQVAAWIAFALGAIGFLSCLQAALNTVWDVQPKRRRLPMIVRERLQLLGGVLVIALLLLVSIGVSSLLTAVGSVLLFISPVTSLLMKLSSFVVALLVATVLFALVFKTLPERRIAWRYIWPGAGVSAFLFVLGQLLLGWYLAHAGVSSAYGAFGGIVVFMLWVNYSAQITLFGAEFTQVYARRRGAFSLARNVRIDPSEAAGSPWRS